MKVKLQVQQHKSVSFETKSNVRFQFVSFFRNKAKLNSPKKLIFLPNLNIITGCYEQFGKF